MNVEEDLEIVGRLDQQQHPARPILDVVAVLAGKAVEGDAVAPVEHAGDARRDLLGNREADGALDAHLVEAPIVDAGVAVGLAARLAGNEIDRAARGVAAIERALRAFQHLDALGVEELEELAGRRSEIDVVDIDADGAGDVGVEVVDADAADEDVRVHRTERGLDIQARRLQRQILHVFDAEPLDGLAGKGGDGHRRRLQVFALALRSDDDALEKAVFVGIGAGRLRILRVGG